jgi:hypothetical protein
LPVGNFKKQWGNKTLVGPEIQTFGTICYHATNSATPPPFEPSWTTEQKVGSLDYFLLITSLGSMFFKLKTGNEYYGVKIK